MKIKFLFTEEYPMWKRGLTELKEALKDLKITSRVQLIKVRNLRDAKKYDFIGSPTIRINEAEIGRDAWKIDETGTEVKEIKPNLTCRIYLFNGKIYEYPPKGMIKDFIKTYVVWKETDKASDDEGIVLE